MAQNITIQGASYSDVPSVELPKTGGGTASFVDVTDTTAAASDVASGKYFYTAAGVKTEGTASGGGGNAKKGTVTVTEELTTLTIDIGISNASYFCMFLDTISVSYPGYKSFSILVSNFPGG